MDKELMQEILKNGTSKNGVLTLSYSQLDTFLQCENQWKLKYKDGLREDVESISLEYGSVVHSIMEEGFSSEMLFGCKPQKEDLLEIWNKNIGMFDKFDIGEEERQVYSDGLLENIDNYIKSTGFYEEIKDMQVVGVEQPFVLQFDVAPYSINYQGELIENDKVYLKGYIDLVLKGDDGYYVIDHKTSKKKFDKKKLRTNLQLPIYAEAIKQLYGEYPVGGYYNFTKINKFQKVMFTDKITPKMNEIMDKRGAKDIWATPPSIARQKIIKVVKGMISNKFSCTPTPLCYWCPFSTHQKDVCENSSDWKPKQF